MKQINGSITLNAKTIYLMGVMFGVMITVCAILLMGFSTVDQNPDWDERNAMPVRVVNCGCL